MRGMNGQLNYVNKMVTTYCNIPSRSATAGEHVGTAVEAFDQGKNGNILQVGSWVGTYLCKDEITCWNVSILYF